jgi:hypothetical protein
MPLVKSLAVLFVCIAVACAAAPIDHAGHAGAGGMKGPDPAVAACGASTAKALKAAGPGCGKAIVAATKCPPDCVRLVKAIKTSPNPAACSAALHPLPPPAQANLQKVSLHQPPRPGHHSIAIWGSRSVLKPSPRHALQFCNPVGR